MLCVYFYQYLEAQGRKYQHLMFSLSNKRLFRVFPGLKRGTKPKQACILTHTTLPRSKSNKDHSSLLPVVVYFEMQKNCFCNYALEDVLEIFFLSPSPFLLSLAYFLSSHTWSATAAHPWVVLWFNPAGISTPHIHIIAAPQLDGDENQKGKSGRTCWLK